MHKEPCGRAEYLVKMMKRNGLYAVSTGAQARPSTEGGSATYVLSSDASKKTQIDYVIMRRRDKNQVRSCRTSWLPSGPRWGVVRDHAMLTVEFDIARPAAKHFHTPRRQWASWSRDPEWAQVYIQEVGGRGARLSD